jgi:hypothetical protein
VSVTLPRCKGVRRAAAECSSGGTWCLNVLVDKMLAAIDVSGVRRSGPCALRVLDMGEMAESRRVVDDRRAYL